MIRRALISVSDKHGVLDFARFLDHREVEILSTGGTARLLADNGVRVTEVSDYTGFPEMMDGRVKTLHPAVHGGILGRRGVDDEVMQASGIRPIDLVVVNLYPFRETVSNPDCSLENAIENIDIGGPAMLRASAKNHRDVTVVVNPEDYEAVMVSMEQNQGAVADALRFDLAVKAFEHTAAYDGAIASYLGQKLDGQDGFPRTLNLQFRFRQAMRYGENPHQTGAFYVDGLGRDSGVSTAESIQGKALSYNNIADTDAAWECVSQFADDSACVIVKHANPCGVALADSPLAAYERAYATDPESAFGGIIAFNAPLDADCCRTIIERQFVEVLIAPDISDDARAVLADKPNVRVLVTGTVPGTGGDLPHFDPYAMDLKRVQGGILVQDFDSQLMAETRVVTRTEPGPDQLQDLLFAWKVARSVKSNAIVYARERMTIGVGAGQMSRVNSARIAAIKAEHAGLEVAGAVMASDAFFPFRDGIDNAAANGIRAIIQPGGSMRDEEVIAAADEHGMAMVFTGTRHFRH